MQEKGQNVEGGEQIGEVALPMAKIMLEVVASELEGLDGLIFDLPPCPSGESVKQYEKGPYSDAFCPRCLTSGWGILQSDGFPLPLQEADLGSGTGDRICKMCGAEIWGGSHAKTGSE